MNSIEFINSRVEIGSLLKEARINVRLTQVDISLAIGVTIQTVSKWESGHTEPKLSQVTKLAELLNITETEICCGVLNDRMSLEEFLILTSRYGHMEVMIAAHNCLPDHDKYFNSLSDLSCRVG